MFPLHVKKCVFQYLNFNLKFLNLGLFQKKCAVEGSMNKCASNGVGEVTVTLLITILTDTLLIISPAFVYVFDMT